MKFFSHFYLENHMYFNDYLKYVLIFAALVILLSVWVIVNGKIQTDECMKNGISAHDLMFKLRAAGIYEISAVKRAVMEQNGQLAVIKYGDESLRYPLITDGQVDPDILEIIKRDEEWLQQELDRLHLEASQVYIGEYIDGKLVAHRYPS